MSDRERTPAEAAAIRIKYEIGSVIRESLLDKPDLTAELNNLLHSGLTYEEIITTALTNKNVSEVINHPFILGLEQTPATDGEDKRFLENLRKKIANKSLSEEDMNNLTEFVLVNRTEMAAGFQNFLLYQNTGLDINPLTEEENKTKSLQKGNVWRNENREKVSQHLETARQSRTEIYKPNIFTPELREKIRELSKGQRSYQEVVELLGKEGICINYESLKNAVQRYDNLRYLGKRTLWQEPLLINNESTNLEMIIQDFAKRNYPNLTQEYDEFVNFLEENSIEIQVSYNSYIAKRKRLLKK